MLRVPLISQKRLQTGFIELPQDDCKFIAVLRLGPVLSKRDEKLQVQLHDAAEVDGKCLVFQTSLLHASQLSMLHPEVTTSGLLGTWKLASADGMVSLVAAKSVDSAEGARAALLAPENPDWLRSRYAAALSETEHVI